MLKAQTRLPTFGLLVSVKQLDGRGMIGKELVGKEEERFVCVYQSCLGVLQCLAEPYHYLTLLGGVCLSVERYCGG